MAWVLIEMQFPDLMRLFLAIKDGTALWEAITKKTFLERLSILTVPEK